MPWWWAALRLRPMVSLRCGFVCSTPLSQKTWAGWCLQARPPTSMPVSPPTVWPTTFLKSSRANPGFSPHVLPMCGVKVAITFLLLQTPMARMPSLHCAPPSPLFRLPGHRMATGLPTCPLKPVSQWSMCMSLQPESVRWLPTTREATAHPPGRPTAGSLPWCLHATAFPKSTLPTPMAVGFDASCAPRPLTPSQVFPPTLSMCTSHPTRRAAHKSTVYASTAQDGSRDLPSPAALMQGLLLAQTAKPWPLLLVATRSF